jgi:hypothetical protein
MCHKEFQFLMDVCAHSIPEFPGSGRLVDLVLLQRPNLGVGSTVDLMSCVDGNSFQLLIVPLRVPTLTLNPTSRLYPLAKA